MWTFSRLTTGVWCIRHYDNASLNDLTIVGFATRDEAAGWIIRWLLASQAQEASDARAAAEQKAAHEEQKAARETELLRVFSQARPVGLPS